MNASGNFLQESSDNWQVFGSTFGPGAGNPSGRSPGPQWNSTSRSAGTAAEASASFLWIDEESGDEVIVEVRGDETFFRELESIGFERQNGVEFTSLESAESRTPRGDEPGSIDESAPGEGENGRLSARMDIGTGRQRGAAPDSPDRSGDNWHGCSGA